MGTSTSVDAFAAKITKAGAEIGAATKTGVNEAALAGKAIFLANMGATRMRNVGRGAKLGARYDASTSNVNPQAILYYTGPAHLLNNPIEPHPIYPRGARVRDTAGAVTKRRRSGGQGLRFADGNVRLYANHPGTAGKHFFERSVPQVFASTDRIMRRSISTALGRAF